VKKSNPTSYAPILFASGDVGGARSLLPVIKLCEKNGIPFKVLNHGFITTEVSGKIFFKENAFSTLAFSSSVKDTIPLTLARNAQKAGVPVLHLLDMWSNYRNRLEMDDLPLFKPEIYAVMDNFSAEQTIKSGIANLTVKVTGQPALASLSDAYNQYFTKDNQITSKFFNQNFQKKSHGFNPEKSLLLFVSEPVSNDQGESDRSPNFRGYTERTVLELFCKSLQHKAETLEIGILPHPRENISEITEIWNKYKGELKGKIIQKTNGRDAVFMADGISGMASILLYEAWLIGKPTLSIQPQLQASELRMIGNKRGVFFTDTNKNISTLISQWLSAVYKKEYSINPELTVHKSSSQNVLDLIIKLRGTT